MEAGQKGDSFHWEERADRIRKPRFYGLWWQLYCCNWRPNQDNFQPNDHSRSIFENWSSALRLVFSVGQHTQGKRHNPFPVDVICCGSLSCERCLRYSVWFQSELINKLELHRGLGVLKNKEPVEWPWTFSIWCHSSKLTGWWFLFFLSTFNFIFCLLSKSNKWIGLFSTSSTSFINIFIVD